MSDLDGTRAHAQAGTPITAVASGKLRTLAGNGALFAETDGLVDAFAEVFARIAASPSRSAETSDYVECRCLDNTKDQQHADTDDDTAAESATADADSLTDQAAGPLISVSENEVVVESTTISPEQLNPKAEPETESHDQKQSLDEELTIAAVEVQQTETTLADDTLTVERITRPAVEAEDTKKPNRDRPEVPGGDLGEPTGRRSHDRVPGADQSIESEHPAHQGEDQSLNPESEQEDVELPRVNRRRYTRNSDVADRVVPSQSNQSSDARRPHLVSNGAQATEPAVDPSGPSTPGAPAPNSSRNAEAVVANVQAASARVDRVNAPSGTQASNRGSAQPLGAADLKRADPRPESDPKPAKQSAADTVSRVKLIQRVSKAFQHLGPEGGVVRLRLAPAEMGAVRVEMRINQRKVQARVIAETEAASTALREHLADLRGRLESFGMQIEKLEIETDTNDQQQNSWFDADSQQNQRKWQRQHQRRFERQTSISEGDVSSDVPRPQIDHGIRITCGVDVRL